MAADVKHAHKDGSLIGVASGTPEHEAKRLTNRLAFGLDQTGIGKLGTVIHQAS